MEFENRTKALVDVFDDGMRKLWGIMNNDLRLCGSESSAAPGVPGSCKTMLTEICNGWCTHIERFSHLSLRGP